jgi:hypothetical protein
MKAEELEWSGTNIHGQNATRDLPSRVEAIEIYFSAPNIGSYSHHIVECPWISPIIG